MSEFKNSQNIALPLIISLVVSVITLIMMAVCFFLVLLSSGNHPFMPGMIGGMSVVPIFGISFAVFLLKSPVRILVDENGLCIEWLIGRKTFTWNDIGSLELRKPGLYQTWASAFSGKKKMPTELLVIFDQNHKKVAEIGNRIENFPLLMQAIRDRTGTAQGRAVFDADAQVRKTLSAQKKSRIFMLVFGIFLAALSVTLSVTSLISHRNQTLLAGEGQVVEAAISRHYLYNVTPRLEYTFTTPGGESFSKNVMVDKRYWETLTEGGTVPVLYLPSKPEENKLLYNDTDNEDFPLAIVIPASAFTFLIGVVCAAMYFLKIADLKFEDGRFKIIRVGDVDSETLAQEAERDEDERISYTVPLEHTAAAVPVYKTAQLTSLPKGLKAIGILNIIFGGLGVLWSGGRIFLALFIINHPDLLMGNLGVPENIS